MAELRQEKMGTENQQLVPELPPPESREQSRRVQSWRTFLASLAHDAEAALAASHAYKQLDVKGRDAWLEHLEADIENINIPLVAVYAPLLAAENCEERRLQIFEKIGWSALSHTPRVAAYAVSGSLSDNRKLAIIVTPMYLNFVRALVCVFTPRESIEWARHDPLLDAEKTPRAGTRFEGVRLESTPLKAVIDELAETVLAHSRNGQKIPEELSEFADLFGIDQEPLVES